MQAVDVDEVLAANKKLGATPQQLEQQRAALATRNQNADFAVWPENWRAVELFTGAGNQWTRAIAPNGRVVYFELPTERIESIARRLPAAPGTVEPPPRTLFAQLAVLEAEAMPLLNRD